MENNHLFYPLPDMGEMAKLDHVMLIESDLMERDIAGRAYNPKLTALRAQHQGLAIAPFTNVAGSIVLAPNVATDVNIPTGTKMIRFNSDGFFVVSRNGRAQIPPVALITGNMDLTIGSFYPNNGMYYYVEEIKQLSIMSDMQVRVSIECFAQI
jgi:hypothetical protein